MQKTLNCGLPNPQYVAGWVTRNAFELSTAWRVTQPATYFFSDNKPAPLASSAITS